MKFRVFIHRNRGVVSGITLSLLLMTCLLWKYSTDSERAITVARVTENKIFELDPKEKLDGKLLFPQRVPSNEKDPNVWTYSLSAAGITEIEMCNNLADLKRNRDFILNRLQGFVGNVPIYIHDPGHDYISSQVKASHNFEPHIFGTIYSYLKKNYDMNLIDVGANIGIISLQAAVLGRKVISIDAAKSNIQHICASAHENDAGGRISLIHNAVSDNHTSVSFVMGKDGEFGASFMDDKNLRQDKIRMSGVKFDTQNLVTC
ncbi:hypothetical protein FSP39_000831 [Pinctada imbricata]|uniref:Uncharacterized protein n=1 Tax=Pinctada imbricata TaxID=66713 RepID=A0AA88XE08_PINIB|nr:hypothetical protein FSP39_000831 [Pinctada imbricata]